MKRCKQCNTEYDNRDNCPNCGSVEYWEVDVWGQPQEPQQNQPQSQPVNLTKEQPQASSNQESAQQAPPTPPPYQPPNMNRQQNYNQPPQPPYGQPPMYSSGAKGMAVAAMVLGILSIILCFVPFVGLGMGIVALCLGVAAKKRLPQGEQGMATAGVVLGIIGIIIGAIVSIFWGIIFAACNTALWEGLSNPYYWY